MSTIIEVFVNLAVRTRGLGTCQSSLKPSPPLKGGKIDTDLHPADYKLKSTQIPVPSLNLAQHQCKNISTYQDY